MIVGFDVSTRFIGIAMITTSGHDVHTEEYKLLGTTFKERLLEAVELFDKVTDAFRHDVDFAVEAPFVGLNSKTALQLARLVGALHGIAWTRAHRRVLEVSPAEAKMALTGDGNASKVEMINAARLQFQLDDISEHEADAIGVCLAALGKEKSDG